MIPIRSRKQRETKSGGDGKLFIPGMRASHFGSCACQRKSFQVMEDYGAITPSPCLPPFTAFTFRLTPRALDHTNGLLHLMRLSLPIILARQGYGKRNARRHPRRFPFQACRRALRQSNERWSSPCPFLLLLWKRNGRRLYSADPLAGQRRNRAH